MYKVLKGVQDMYKASKRGERHLPDSKKGCKACTMQLKVV